MTQAELAERMGRPRKTINEIARGKAELTPDTALQLERVLAIPASFWNAREARYREFLARQRESSKLSDDVDWLREIPVREMVKQGWVGSYVNLVDQMRACLNFFGVASPAQWRKRWTGPVAVFRKSPAFAAHPGAVAAWLRRGELLAREIECAPFDAIRFHRTLLDCRRLTTHPPETFVPELTDRCARAGVAVVFQPTLAKTPLCGATQWLSSGEKAIVLLSLRYKTDDQLWFTFFHEAGHILRHGKQAVFIETGKERGPQEEEADRFAGDLLIPPDEYARLRALGRPDRRQVESFAREIGICPAIVVGRLQHDKALPFAHLNDLKKRFEWTRPQAG